MKEMNDRGPTRFIFVRHGQTEWNAREIWQGHQDSPLTQRGHQQIAALGTRMKTTEFDCLYSSDLGRAWQTAQSIAKATGHSIAGEFFLREKNLGIFEGHDTERLLELYPAEYEQFHTFDPDYVIPHGESIRQFFNRSVAGFETLAERHPQQTVVVVSHGGVLANLFRYIFELPLKMRQRIDIKNTSLNAVSHLEGNWRLHFWGDIAHLEGLSSLS